MTTNADPAVNIKQKTQACFPRVIQTLPANVAITTQPASIRVVHTASHPTPTALVVCKVFSFMPYKYFKSNIQNINEGILFVE